MTGDAAKPRSRRTPGTGTARDNARTGAAGGLVRPEQAPASKPTQTAPPPASSHPAASSRSAQPAASLHPAPLARLSAPSAVLDEAHRGDIEGAFGRIRLDDEQQRRGLKRKLITFLAIIGPGLIVMVGDNDAGGVSTYAQAGQNYGYSLLWTLLLLIPVLIVNQEMVVRPGAVTGVGHARLINERFGRFWGSTCWRRPRSTPPRFHNGVDLPAVSPGPGETSSR